MIMPKVHQIKTFDKFLTKSRARINVVYGGAGSGKSFSVAQHLLKKFLMEKDKKILITRKTLPSLKITAWSLILERLREWGIPVEINKSELTIKFGNNEILAKSLDDPEKIKSFEANYIWIEEATELDKEDLDQLDLRLRRESKDGVPNQIFLTFNPIDAFHWCITTLIQGNRDDVAVHHSTYKDNPFCTLEYAKRLEDFINQDENFYRIYTLGEPGVLENVIYKNYCSAPFPSILNDEPFYGLDFGFNNPSCLIQCIIRDMVPYVKELIYESHLTNSDLIDRMKEFKIGSSAPVYCDAAEPQRIEELNKAGFWAVPADKSVKDGIDYVKRYRIHISPDSPNTLAEIRAYSYRKKGEQVIDEPVKFRDHAMDAIRYALFTHFKSGSGIKIPTDWIGFGGKGEQDRTERFRETGMDDEEDFTNDTRLGG